MNEPRTSVNIEDFTVGFGVDPVDTRLNILCPIVSPAGPTELTRVTGPSMLKRLYFGGRSIKTSDDYSAVFARALSANAPIYIKRGTRDYLKGGRSCFTGDPIYTDSSLNPISGLKAKFTKSAPAAGSGYTDLIAAVNGVVTDYNAYSPDLAQPASIDPLLIAGTKIEDSEVKTILKLTSANATEDMILTIGDRQYTIPKGEDTLNDLVAELAAYGYCPQCVLKSGDVVKATFRSGTWTSGDIDELRWLSKVSITTAKTYSQITISYPTDNNLTLDMAKIKSETEFIETSVVVAALIDVEIEDDVYSFYTGAANPDGIPINLGDDTTFYGLMQRFTREIAVRFGGDSSVGNTVIIPGASSVTVGSGVSMTVSTSQINTSEYNDRFAVLSAFPCDGNYISVTMKKSTDYVVTDEEGNVVSDPEVYTIQADYANGDISETWDISFDSGLVDGYGESLYYQRVNEESQLIRVVELYGESFQSQSFDIGSQISSVYCGKEEIISAYESMVEKEEASVMFDYITDGGIIDAGLSSYIKQMCQKYHSFYPASVPTDVTLTEARLKSRRTQIGTSQFMNCIGATQRGAFLDSGSAIYPASYYYLVRRIDLGNTSSEFMPIFAQSSGDIGMQRPLQKFDVETRERLLDVQIPTLKREANGLYCVNLNLTCWPQKSYLQEDGVVLMINKINQIADVYAKSVISMPNTDRTRDTIQTSLTQSINGRLRVGTEYGPQSIRVQCDRSNNPQTLIDQWKVRVDIYATFANSIREVLIYTNILPLQ